MADTPLPRDLFPATDRWVYMNHAGVAPLPRTTVEAITRWAEETALDGGVATTAHEEQMEDVRAAAARLMGVPVSDVAFVKNTSEGLGFVANGLEWQPDDRVVVPDLEFQSTIYPWLALEDRGVVVDRVAPIGEAWALPVEAFADVITAGPAPKVVATSWVQYGRGWRADIEALARVCHGVGALFCVDVIQGLGVLPAQLDAWGVDFAMADGHKWLLSSAGAGVMYVRGSLLDQLHPLEPGWNSVVHREEWSNLDLVWDTTARRLEGGSLNAAGILGLGASLEMLLAAGTDAIWRHVDMLCARIVDGVRDLGGDILCDRATGASGIVSFRFPDVRNRWLYEQLENRRIAVSARGRAVRVSPHGYNTVDEVDALLQAMRELLDGHGSVQAPAG